MNALARLPELLPEALAPFLDIALAHGFSPSLVGGAVRDLLLGAPEIHDWDFELAHPKGSNQAWEKLLRELRPFYKLENQAHHVVKARPVMAAGEFEFAPPRVETYPPKDTYSHSDFEAKTAFALDPAAAALRRDFTVNALAARFDGREWVLVDPFDGTGDLARRELVPCSPEHFPKDPVRFLRAHRFALKLGFSFSLPLADLLEQMDLTFLTAHYVGEEARKSGRPFAFWNRIQEAPTLPAKFHGGLPDPEGMQRVYDKHLPRLGVSNALLAAVFSRNEGWHLLQPLGGKGEKEVATWRERREGLRQLKGTAPADIPVESGEFRLVCQLVKTPLHWLQEDWVRDVLAEQGLSWLAERPWPNTDLRAFPPHERHERKVAAWLLT